MGRTLVTERLNNSLTVLDNRTGKVFTIPIVDNSIPATAFKAMTASMASEERAENETEKGLRVADGGFLNTAVIRSQITFIDGEAGSEYNRGYPIEQLALHSTHLETAYLLIYGALPTVPQFEIFSKEVMHHGVTHADAELFFRSFRYDAHPMAILTSAFAYLGSYCSEANPSLQGQNIFTKGDEASLARMDKQIYRLIGKATTLAAMAYRVRQGREFVTPPTNLSYTGSFLYQMDHMSEENYVPNPILEKALDVLFLLHADHELNASATTVLQTGSSLVDPYSAIAAGCASLYGPLHGGANEAVIRMLITIGKPENVPAFIEAVKKREKVLSGFGHRVYKTSDPRSFIVRKTADEVFNITGKDELLETAMALHEAAMKDKYFIERRLAPNVDFCGLIYRAMGFPLDFFPVLFAVPRVVGWLAHWRQASIIEQLYGNKSLIVTFFQMMLQEGGVKIWRPRQIYIGAGKREYVPIGGRVAVEGPKVTPSVVVHSGITKRTNLATFKGKAAAKL
ncbi:peroxysomal citrate synthase [Collybia nuda]|uniref:Citrate synthase n=1 Tax=Collybia nuda TaxID=64659 RepID=A0A9P5XU40_9AGAR|nr:peroxysomal citrate synthase [Collybia nuda]